MIVLVNVSETFFLQTSDNAGGKIDLTSTHD